MAVVNLHDMTGNLVEVDTLTMVECEELPDCTEIVAIKRIHGLSRYPISKKGIIRVQERKADIRKKLLEHPEIFAAIPACLVREKKTFEQIRAERNRNT